MTPDCVRPFKAYDLSEEVEVRVAGQFYPGEVVKQYGGDLYDIEVEDVGLVSRVTPDDIRRLEGDRTELKHGMAVYGRFQGGNEWYSGKIHAIHSDGSIDILYDDGDFEQFVQEKHYYVDDDDFDD
jgi:hypothetical protein